MRRRGVIDADSDRHVQARTTPSSSKFYQRVTNLKHSIINIRSTEFQAGIFPPHFSKIPLGPHGLIFSLISFPSLVRQSFFQAPRDDSSLRWYKVTTTPCRRSPLYLILAATPVTSLVDRESRPARNRFYCSGFSCRCVYRCYHRITVARRIWAMNEDPILSYRGN